MKSFSEMLKSKGGFRRAIYDAVAEIHSKPSGLDMQNVNKVLHSANTLTEGYIDNPRTSKPSFVVYDFPLGREAMDGDFIFYLTEVDNQKIYYKYKFTGSSINVSFHLIY